MKRTMHSKWGALLCAGALLTLTVWAQDKQDKKPDTKSSAPPAADAATEEMMKKISPGPEHKVLDDLVGEWTVTAKFWMNPGAEPMETKGTSTKKWILGGRFVEEQFTGDFMGMPFNGFGLHGYDNMKKKYVGFWVDSMGTGMTTNEGDAAGKVITLKGTMDDPMSGERNKPMKMVLTIVSKDKHVLEMHDLTHGDKSKTGEVIYVRK